MEVLCASPRSNIIKRLTLAHCRLENRSHPDRRWCKLIILRVKTWRRQWKLIQGRIVDTLMQIVQWWVRLCNRWQMFESRLVDPVNLTRSRPSSSRLIVIKWSSFKPKPHALSNKLSLCRKASESLSKMRWEIQAVWSILMCPKVVTYSTGSLLQWTRATIKSSPIRIRGMAETMVNLGMIGNHQLLRQTVITIKLSRSRMVMEVIVIRRGKQKIWMVKDQGCNSKSWRRLSRQECPPQAYMEIAMERR